MKIIAVSDKVVENIYSVNINHRFSDVKLVLGCGDLPYYYLEFIISILNIPLLYVHGNHDPQKEYTSAGQYLTGPGGGINIDGRLLEVNGLLIAGLEGSIRYRPEGAFQYTQAEMWWKVLKLAPRLQSSLLRHGRNIDILVAHSPPFDIHNGDDHVHTGFKSFLWLMKAFKPRYLIHGHRHILSQRETTQTKFENTHVINIYPYKLIEIERAE